MENGVWLSEPDRSLVTGKMGEGGKEESPTEFTDVGDADVSTWRGTYRKVFAGGADWFREERSRLRRSRRK